MLTRYEYKTPDLFLGKSQDVKDLYDTLLDELDQIGPVRKTSKEVSIAFENRKMFASVMIRNRSIKLVLRTDHKLKSSRILGSERVADMNYDHTIVLDTKDDIDSELMNWLGDAYQASH